MGQIRAKMKRLSKPDPQYVSLVRRSANMIPFRIQKAAGETMGLDLTSISRILKAGPQPKCTVAALVVRKSDNFDAVKDAIKKAGFSVDKVTENEDGTVLFAQTDDPETDSTVVRQSENLAVVLKAFPHDEMVAPFNAAVGGDDYIEGLRAGTNALTAFVLEMASTKPAEEARVEIQKAAADFAAYADALVDVIPAAAYAADAAIGDIIRKAAGANDGAAPVAQPKTAATTQPQPQSLQDPGSKKLPNGDGTELSQNSTNTRNELDGKIPKKKKLTETGTVASENTNAGAEMQPGTDHTAESQASDLTADPGTGDSTNGNVPPTPKVNSSVADVHASTMVKAGTEPDPFAEVKALIAGIATKLESVSKAQTEQGVKVDTAMKEASEAKAELVKKTGELEKVLKSTVVAAAPAGDPFPRESVLKDDEDLSKGPVGDGVWDSARHRRSSGRNR